MVVRRVWAGWPRNLRSSIETKGNQYEAVRLVVGHQQQVRLW